MGGSLGGTGRKRLLGLQQAVYYAIVSVFKDDAIASGRVGEDVENAGVQESEPVLTRGLAPIEDENWTTGDIVFGRIPEPLVERMPRVGEVVERLSEPLLWVSLIQWQMLMAGVLEHDLRASVAVVCTRKHAEGEESGGGGDDKGAAPEQKTNDGNKGE